VEEQTVLALASRDSVAARAIREQTIPMILPPAGGPATIYGVLYQMLWSLLRALKMNVRECHRSPTDNKIDSAILVLEPRGGGGDVQERSGRRRIVEQLKAKAAGGTWSLREVVEEVLPDLYLARATAIPETEYRFVTEGRMGGWSDVYKLFQGMTARLGARTDVIGCLDDREEVKFQRRTSALADRNDQAFWPLPKYTEKTIFERIVEEVRKRRTVANGETVEQTRQGVWELLANFTFIAEQTTDVVQREIDALLLALVDTDIAVAEKRDAMLTGLSRRATHGGAEIDAQQFLGEYALNSAPLTDWGLLRERAAVYLDGSLARAGYDQAVDVRRAVVAELATSWQPTVPILAISGQSGGGKSWLLYALAQYFASSHGLVIVTDATGDGDMDCQKAADIFWKRIKRNDNSLSLDRIADRRHELVQPRAEQWLTLFIDGIQSQREAKQLATQPWEDWNIRVVCTGLPSMARALKAEARDRCRLHDVSDFALAELHEYLNVRLEGAWGRIPFDVRDTLRRPLLARLYCDLAPSEGWAPANEYELYSRCWQRLREGEQGDHPLDAVPLLRLARQVLEGGTYPWTINQLHTAGLNDEVIGRLCRAGWLQPVAPTHYQIWHDRLLNWAVAESLCAALESGEVSQADLGTRLQELYNGPTHRIARPLGYVPMDVLWLLTDSARGTGDAVDAIIEALESAP
jgi:hypothetical protein